MYQGKYEKSAQQAMSILGKVLGRKESKRGKSISWHVSLITKKIKKK